MVKGNLINDKVYPHATIVGAKSFLLFFFFFLVKSQRSDQTAFCSGVADALLSKAHFGGYSTGVAVAVWMDQWTLNLLSDSFHVKANHHSLIVNEYLNKAPVKMACLKMDAQIIHAHWWGDSWAPFQFVYIPFPTHPMDISPFMKALFVAW